MPNRSAAMSGTGCGSITDKSPPRSSRSRLGVVAAGRTRAGKRHGRRCRPDPRLFRFARIGNGFVMTARASAAEPAGPVDPETTESLSARLEAAAQTRLGRSLAIRHVNTGSCNGCELELRALSNVLYDLERFGLRFVESPRHADVLLVTGPLTRNLRTALEQAWDATPDPKWVVAVGDCAVDGGVFKGSYAVLGGTGLSHPGGSDDRRMPAAAGANTGGAAVAAGSERRSEIGLNGTLGPGGAIGRPTVPGGADGSDLASEPAVPADAATGGAVIPGRAGRPVKGPGYSLRRTEKCLVKDQPNRFHLEWKRRGSYLPSNCISLRSLRDSRQADIAPVSRIGEARCQLWSEVSDRGAELRSRDNSRSPRPDTRPSFSLTVHAENGLALGLIA